MKFKLAIAFLIAATLSAVVQARPMPETGLFTKQVDALVEQQMRAERVPGMAVAVLFNGQLIVAKGYGRATLEHDVPVTPNTIFQSGSVGKMFVSTAILSLVDQGQMSLDDPVKKFLINAPAAWHAITIRQLLTHTSGIPDFEETFDLRRDYTDDELVQHAYSLPLDFAPGTRWSYSNTGYVLLGIVAKIASGKPYLETIDSRIFKPLGMLTARGISEADIVPNRASGYQLVGDAVQNQEWVSPTMNSTADGSLYLSLNDMIAWSRGIDRQAVISAASWKQMFTPVKLASGKPYPYGFGWNIDKVSGHARYHHGGGWQGFRSNYARYPDDGLAIIIFANSVSSDLGKLNDGIAALWDADLVDHGPARQPAAEPAIDRRVTALIASARAGTLTPQDISMARAGFVEAVNRYFPELLAGYGPLAELRLVDRRERGDDMVYIYSARLGDQMLKIEYWLAPNGQSPRFMISK